MRSSSSFRNPEYTKVILERFGMSDSTSVATPTDKSHDESLNLVTLSAGDIPYRQELGVRSGLYPVAGELVVGVVYID